MGKIHIAHIARIEHLDCHGKVLWHQEDIDNLLHDQGEIALLSAYFATGMVGYGAAPANLYLGLDNRASLAETDTLSSLSGEPTGTGYARKPLVTNGSGASGQDFYVNQPGTFYRADSKTIAFVAGGAWTGVSKCFLATTLDSTGKLICSIPLSQTRTLALNETLNVSIYVGMSE